MKNPYCTVDELGFPRFDGIDFLRYKALPNNSRLVTGENYLWAYKAAYLHYNKELIINYAHKENIPVLLLAGVAVAEAGGTPDRIKAYGVLQIRQLFNDTLNGNNKKSNATSVGVLAIQLRAAAETLGIEPSTLTTTQQLQLANCLLTDDFNISIVAKHLKDLILFDNPNMEDTSILTDEQLILAGSRYNRGIERDKNDIIKSISSPIGTPEREYSSYGRRILEKKKSIYKILGIEE
ncbi:hypothetical protein KKI90_22625 [Xenorhabdus bovienii]|uniref:hypothetical protein n=1 Tax=Xenorhabdus bovienii TaxID=40576 RepID=UPI00237C8573|nr:hypothetical protein [Xenorhabdus bovienii]MDE1489021.1 hypothetical protein [Xenorhabdus bovienii]MDE9479899.1 hypothetical protein [Xenorhabdus bovienii]MDE9532832.1 hypothetical protein [Xenorhabdus bovienii]